MKEKRLHPSIMINLKNKGYDIKKYSNNELISILKKEYYIDLDVNFIMKNKKQYIPIIPKENYVIYVLFDKEEIVYVGMSKNLIYRIGQHQSNKIFNAIYVVEIENDKDKDIKTEEFKYICRLYPKYNNEVKDNKILTKFINETFY